MFDLRAMLQQWSPPQRREILYYLVRYFKQSHFLSEDGKDIFNDVFDRSPTDEMRATTLQAISAIEAEIGQKASEFDDSTAGRILGLLTKIEDEIEDSFTQVELGKASAFLRRLNLPSPR